MAHLLLKRKKKKSRVEPNVPIVICKMAGNETIAAVGHE